MASASIRQPSDTAAERDFVRRLLPFSALDLRTRSGARGGAALGKYIIVRPRLFLTLIPAIPTQIPTCPLSLTRSTGRTRTSNQTVMSGTPHPKKPEKSDD